MEWEKISESLDLLLASGRTTELRGALRMLNPVDIATYLETLKDSQLLRVFRILPKDISADVFSYMSPEQQQTLIGLVGDKEVCKLIEDMFLDDAVDFLEELPSGVVKRILQNAGENTRNQINQFLSYPEYSAGSIMTIEYVEFRENSTVAEAMRSLRKTGLDKETIYTCYIIDSSRHLTGTIALRRLIMAEDDQTLIELMERNVISVETTDDQEFVADTVRKYDLMSIPVVDKEHRLCGIVTADDIMDVIEEENTEDFERMAALLPADNEYLKTPVFTLFKNRIPWLLILMLTATITGVIITGFEGFLTASGALGVALTASIPMLMNTGGNCGSQASTLIIRGLALGEVEFKDILRVIWREVRVAILVGLLLCLVNFLRMILFTDSGLPVAAVISLAMFITVIFSKCIGCVLPMLAKKINLDPALMASPVITTLVDTFSIGVLLILATQLLN